MSKRKKKSLLLLLLIVAASASLAALRGQRGGQAPANDEEPTPIREGVVTKKQKEHGRIFRGYNDVSGGRKIKDLVAQRGEVTVWAPVYSMPHLPPVGLGEYLQKLTCDADAVIVGKVRSKTSNLTESGTFLFTDYEVAVEEVLKNNSSEPIQQGGEVTVTRGGGTASLEGHIVRAIDRYRGRLEVEGSYTLYLRFIAETGSYRAFTDPTSEDTFKLNGGKVWQVSPKQWPLGQHGTIDASTFLVEARNALTAPCARRGVR